MVTSNWSPHLAGGAEVYVADLTARLRTAGHDVHAVTLGVPGDDVVAVVPPRPHPLHAHGRATAAAKAAFHAADLHHPATGRVIADAARRVRPDVVHSHVVAGMSVQALTTPARLGLPHVHTVHDHWLRCWRSTGTTKDQRPCGASCRALARLRAGALRRAGPQVVVGISRAVLDAHAASGLGTAASRVLHHPATPPPQPVPRRQRRRSGPVTVGFLGQLNPNKGVGTLLEAAGRLDPAEARVVVAGRGRLDADVAASGVDHRGWVAGEEKERFFADIDVLVVPSRWEEPAGLVVLEAAARGVPVIASRVGGLPEYVPAPCRPLLFPAGAADALVDRIRRFAADPDRHAVDPTAVGGWDPHIEAIVAAYADAGAQVGSAA